jgi:hypothetical protein
MRVTLCGEQLPKAIVDRRSGDDYSRKPAAFFYVTCQREEGHDGEHVGQYFGGQVHWSVQATPREPGDESLGSHVDLTRSG